MNGAWMRDPLRAGMEARVRGTQRLALGAALTLAFFALALKLCAAMEGAAANVASSPRSRSSPGRLTTAPASAATSGAAIPVYGRA